MSRAVVAVDVGGTSIKGALVDASGTELVSRRVPTPVADGPTAVVESLLSLVGELAAQGDVAAVGVVVPGVVDREAGIARFSANLGWRDLPLAATLAQRTGLPTVLEHDVRAAGVADAHVGPTAATQDSLLVVLGTGVAAVVRAGGQIVSGAAGIAGELGHLVVVPGGEPCPCGQFGCLERYASAAAIARRYVARGGADGTSAAEVAAMLESDPAAAQAWDDAIQALAGGLASAVTLLDPALIAVAGGLAEAGDVLLAPLTDAVRSRLPWRAAPPIVASPLGSRAGLAGAAILAWQVAS